MSSNPDSSRRELILSRLREALAPLLPDFLVKRRWFGGKSRAIRSATVLDVVPLPAGIVDALIAVIRVEYAIGPGETYSLPLLWKPTEHSIAGDIASLTVTIDGVPEPTLLYDAMSDPEFLSFLLEAIADGRCYAGVGGEIKATPTSALSKYWQADRDRLQPVPMKVEQSNSSVVYGGTLVLKLFRRLEEGINPDVEIGTFLTEKTRFANVPAVAGHLEYVGKHREPSSLGILQTFVRNQGDAWRLTLDAVREYYERAKRTSLSETAVPRAGLLAMAEQAIPKKAESVIGVYMDWARLLGERTAELHLALASEPGDPNFSPEPFVSADTQSFCDSAIELLTRNFDLLRQRRHLLGDRTQAGVLPTLELEESARYQFRSLLYMNLTAKRTRIHGDYHLGQVLFTGNDFVIIDFEGEPARSLAERRAKRSPLQDVASMLRSFHYAAYAPVLAEENEEARRALDVWARYWYAWVAAMFLRTYIEVCGKAPHIPQDRFEMETLLDAYILDKAVYELGYELNNRPEWLAIPLQGVASLLSNAPVRKRNAS